MRIYEDNQSCISMLHAEGGTRTRNQHEAIIIYTRYNFIQNLFRSGVYDVKYCPTEDMLADMLTKPLARIKLQNMREGVNLQKKKMSLRRSVEVGKYRRSPRYTVPLIRGIGDTRFSKLDNSLSNLC